MSIKYKKINWKYLLLEDISYQTDIFRFAQIPNFVANNHGKITIYKNYAWDGPSGPTIDTESFMKGSLIHDALYQLMREGQLDRAYRKKADKLLRKICREEGMNPIRAWYVYWAVRLFAGKFTK